VSGALFYTVLSLVSKNRYIIGILKIISKLTALYVTLMLLHVPATNRSHLQRAAVRGDTWSVLMQLVSITSTSCAVGVCMRRAWKMYNIT
jgi:hypothetical protein